MRPWQIIGLVLVALGVFVLWKRPAYTSQEDVVKFGDFKASVNTEKPIPAGWGAAAIAAGVVLLLAGARKRE
jgi:hypothetical protein